jgi:hypothetical protein
MIHIILKCQKNKSTIIWNFQRFPTPFLAPINMFWHPCICDLSERTPMLVPTIKNLVDDLQKVIQRPSYKPLLNLPSLHFS